jgi:membrane-associated protein
VVVARWIPWVRTFTPLVAGAAVMDRRAFTSANVVGALPWAVGLPVLGYAAYQLPVLRSIAYAVAAFFILGSLVWVVVTVRRGRQSRPAPASTAAAGESRSEP